MGAKQFPPKDNRYTFYWAPSVVLSDLPSSGCRMDVISIQFLSGQPHPFSRSHYFYFWRLGEWKMATHFSSTSSLLRSSLMRKSNPHRPPCSRARILPRRRGDDWFCRGMLISSLMKDETHAVNDRFKKFKQWYKMKRFLHHTFTWV